MQQENNKTNAAIGYRPFIELDCQFIKQAFSLTELKINPLTVIDVGAARGFDLRWNIFKTNCKQFGFEPDPSEFLRLEEQYRNDDTKKLLPYALAASQGTRTLHITKDRDSSSLYRPYEAFFRRLPDPTLTEIVETISVETKTLDQLQPTFPGEIDVLKIDVQGAELDVLRGAKQTIQDGILAVVSEAEFTREYHDQPLFADLDIFLRENGFQLFDIDVRRWRKRELSSEFTTLRTGQLIYGDVLYLKDPIEYPNKFCKSSLEREKLLKLIALSEFFSVPDYGIEILELAQNKNFISYTDFLTYSAMLRSNSIIKVNDRNRRTNT